MLGALNSVQGQTSLYRAARTLHAPVSGIHRALAPHPQSGLRRLSGPSVSLWGKRQQRLHMAHSPPGAAAQAASEPTAGASDLGPVVQYVVVRKDLKEGMGWPLVRGGPELLPAHRSAGHAATCAPCQVAPLLRLSCAPVTSRRPHPPFVPQGSIVAQACHACVAAVWENRDDPTTSKYCAPEAIDSMHKARAAPVPGSRGPSDIPSGAFPPRRSAVAVLASSELLQR